MSKSIILTIIASLAFLAITSTGQTKEKCCNDIAFGVIHVCLGLPHELELNLQVWKVECWVRSEEDKCTRMCWSIFCEDGYRILNIDYCGIGKCNRRGCHCDGGCRKNQGIDHEELKKAWLAKHGLIKHIIVEPKEMEPNKSFKQRIVELFKKIFTYLKFIKDNNRKEEEETNNN